MPPEISDPAELGNTKNDTSEDADEIRPTGRLQAMDSDIFLY
jgi:hypothetical protein